MEPQSVQRKLTAIFSADVKGYSRLMGEDEVATVRTLIAYREVMASLIQQHRGRVVDSPGDNLLAEFASVVDAVQCAVEIQQVLRAKNAELPENRRMEFRIGVNLGDVIEEEDRIYGDGVNIAARVEGLAEGGGICISGTAYDQIESKLALGYEYLGEHAVKNITKPVRVYRAQIEPGAVAPGVSREKRVGLRRWQWATLTVVAVLVVGAGAVAVWNFYLRLPPPLVEVVSKEKMAFQLPEKPSIAVLPFVNMSGDPKQEYFADGMTEDLITDLSKLSGLFVISRNSAFTYKGKSVKIRQVAEELGVRYVLEGSVRKSGEQVRINAQLIDTTTGHHLWAKRYDRKLKEIFEVQDGITSEIVMALNVRLVEGEQARLYRKGTESPEAYDYFMKGLAPFRRFRKRDNALARKMVEKALELDPKSVEAISLLAWIHWEDARFGWSPSRSQSFKIANELAFRAFALDDTSPDVHALLGGIYLYKREYDLAVTEGELAVALAPNGADYHAVLAQTLLYAGMPEDAIVLIKRAMRLSPFYPKWYIFVLGEANRLMGRYEEAIAAFKAYIDRSPNSKTTRVALAATLIALGRKEEASVVAAEILKVAPQFSLELWGKSQFYKDPKELDRLIDLARKAGLK